MASCRIFLLVSGLFKGLVLWEEATLLGYSMFYNIFYGINNLE